MREKSIALAAFLLLHYGLIEAHAYDVHLPNSEEEHMIEEYKERVKAAELWKTFHDEERSEVERRNALGQLNDLGEIN
jgi:hypothetical protein